MHDVPPLHEDLVRHEAEGLPEQSCFHAAPGGTVRKYLIRGSERSDTQDMPQNAKKHVFPLLSSTHRHAHRSVEVREAAFVKDADDVDVAAGGTMIRNAQFEKGVLG
jgi:hypothetical protein